MTYDQNIFFRLLAILTLFLKLQGSLVQGRDGWKQIFLRFI